MQTFWEIVASNALLVVVLAGGVATLGRFWKNPFCLHLLWVFVLLKFVTPPIVTVPLLPPAGQASAETSEASLAAADSPPIEASQQQTAPMIAESNDVRGLSGDPATPETAESAPSTAPFGNESPNIPWLSVLGWIWVAGTVAVASRHVYRILRFQRLLSYGETPSSAVLDMAQGVAKRLGLRRVPEIRMLPVCISPLVWSLGGSPRVILPTALFVRLNSFAQESILAHELAHVRRKDHWVRLLELVITTLFWWHPVVWRAARQLQQLEDECCDCLVVDFAPHGVKSYATALLDTLDFLSERSMAAPLGATAAKSSTSLARRIAMLQERSRTVRWTFGRVMLVLAAAAFPMTLAFGQKPPAAADKTASPADSTQSSSPRPAADVTTWAASGVRATSTEVDPKTPQVMIDLKVLGLPRDSDLVRRLPNGGVILNAPEAKKLLEEHKSTMRASPRLLCLVGQTAFVQIGSTTRSLACHVLPDATNGNDTIALQIWPALVTEPDKNRAASESSENRRSRTRIHADLKQGEAVAFGGWDDADDTSRDAKMVTVFLAQASLAEPAKPNGRPGVERRSVNLSTSRPKRSAPIAPGGPLGISVEKADLMGRVEWAMMHGAKDITARKTIEWGDVEKGADGNRKIRYKFLATIWDKDVFVMNKVFTFDASGNILDMEDVEGFPQRKVDKPANVTTQAGMKELVEDFFSKNFRDITSREAIEWGDVVKDAAGNSSIRYKYRAKIWDKETKIMNQLFTFDAKGKFVSVKNADEPSPKP